jgi:hypothetical protein
VIRAVRNLLLLSVLGVLALPAAAQADPVSDCSGDGDLDRRYSNSELQRALDNIPSEIDEYTDCRAVIGGAIRSGSDRGGNRPEAGASTAGGDGDRRARREQQERAGDSAELEAITADKEGSPTVDVGGEPVAPGGNGLFDLASASNDVPVPLLVALIAVGLLAILGTLVALRERVPALARIPLLSKIPRVSLPRFRR